MTATDEVERNSSTQEDSQSEKADSLEHLTPHQSRAQQAQPAGPALEVADEQDGGFLAWVRVFAAWLTFLMTWGPALSFGTFQNYYETHTPADQTPSNISWIGSTSTTLLIMGGVIAGPLFDRGYLKSLMAIGCILQILGFMMLSLATEYYQIFLSQGICYGLGCGVVYIPALAFVTTSFKKHRALAVGITTTGSSMGGVVFPLAFRSLLPSIGFAWSCRVIGFIQLGCAAIALPILFQAPVRRQRPRSLIDWSAFRSAPFDFFFVTGFCQFLAYWVPLFYIPAFAISRLGASTDMAVYLTVILNAASAFGRVFPAFAVAKFGAAPVVAIATVLATIIMFTWFAVTSLAGFIVWCVAFGIVTGVFVSANPIVVTHPSISSFEVLGTRLGMLWFAGACGALVGGPIAGALADPATGNFDNALGFASAIMGLGLICMSGVMFCINRWDKKESLEKHMDSP